MRHHAEFVHTPAARLSYDSEPLKEWAGQRSGPVAIYNDERPRAGWAEILLLAERLVPEPPLLPRDPADRALVFGLAHIRVTELLGMLAARLKAQRAAGSHFYIGDSLTAVDVYSATFMALFAPLPHTQCAMDPVTRQEQA